MSLFTIRALMGASLYAPHPCILATFHLESDEVKSSAKVDDKAYPLIQKQLKQLAPTIDDSSDELDPDLPVIIGLIKQTADTILRQLQLKRHEIIVSENAASKTVFLAIPELERQLTANIALKSINYILDTYRSVTNNQKNEQHFSSLQQFITSAQQLKKTRVTRDIQICLEEENYPWFSLDFDIQTIDWFQIGFGREQQLYERAVTFNSSHLGVSIASSKKKTNAFLSNLGFRVPKQATAKTLGQAKLLADQIGYPVVVKSDIGTGGSRVYADLRSFNEVKTAYEILQTKLQQLGLQSDILIEKHMPGRIYRVEVVKGEVFDAYDMMPAAVTGDGIHTVEELIVIENQLPSRKSADDLAGKYVPLKLETAEMIMLEKQGLKPDSIPVTGKEVRLHANSNWSTGGTFTEVTDKVHPDNLQLIQRAAQSLDIDMLGIDLITEDLSLSFITTPITFIEVNHAPQLGGYFDDDTGEYVDVCRRLITKLFPKQKDNSVPIITIKKTTLSRETQSLLAQCLNKSGYPAGVINDAGIEVDGQIWSAPAEVNFQNPNLQLLRNINVGAALVERSNESLADFGLSTGNCDISILLNPSNQIVRTRTWPQGISGHDINKLLIQHSRKTVILLITNQDELELAKSCPSGKLFALFIEPEGLERELADKANFIRVNRKTERSLEVTIRYEQSLRETTLKLDREELTIPSLVSLATLLSLSKSLKDAVSLVESSALNLRTKPH